MGRSWSSTHTYTCKYVFRRREEKSSYTLPFTLLYNIAIILVAVIIHARNAHKSECGNNGHWVEETAAFPSDYTWRLPNHTRRTTKCVPLPPSAYLLLLHLLLLGVATNMAIRMKTKLGGFGSLLTTIAISHFKHCQNFYSVFDEHLKKVKIHWATPEGS